MLESLVLIFRQLRSVGHTDSVTLGKGCLPRVNPFVTSYETDLAGLTSRGSSNVISHVLDEHSFCSVSVVISVYINI